MDELIEALTIFRKYMSDTDAKYPTSCEQDVLFVCGVDIEVSEEDKARLEELSFFPGTGEGEQDSCDTWHSYRILLGAER